MALIAVSAARMGITVITKTRDFARLAAIRPFDRRSENPQPSASPNPVYEDR